MAPSTLKRRHYLALAGGSVIGPLAGCLSDDDTEPPNDDDGDPPADDTDDDPDDHNDADADPDPDDDADPDDAPDPDDDADDEPRQRLGDIFTPMESFAMSVVTRLNGEEMTMQGRFDRGNMFWEVTVEGQQMSWYIVDGTSYFVMDDQCFIGVIDDEFDPDEVDPGEFEEDAMQFPDLEPIGTDHIDNEPVLVYRLDAGDADHDEDILYYIHEETGYLRRMEVGATVWDFHSWGDVDPIEAPEMDCQEFPDFDIPDDDEAFDDFEE